MSNKTLESIEDVTRSKNCLRLLLKRGTDTLTVINDVKLGIFSGKKKLTREYIRTLLLKENQPISTVIEIAKDSNFITIPTKFKIPAGSEAVLSCRIAGREFSVKFEL